MAGERLGQKLICATIRVFADLIDYSGYNVCTSGIRFVPAVSIEGLYLVLTVAPTPTLEFRGHAIYVVASCAALVRYGDRAVHKL